jgi:taurine--2-oxoglutarate transaminase
VKNQTTKEPFNTYTDKVSGKPLLVDQIAGKMLAEGVIMQAWVSHFVIAPPLIVEKDEIERGIAMLDKWLHLADEMCVADVGVDATKTMSVTSDS